MRYVLDVLTGYYGKPIAMITKDEKTGVIQTYKSNRTLDEDYYDVNVIDQTCTWGDMFQAYPPEDIDKLDTCNLLGYFEGRGYECYASVNPSDYKAYQMKYNRYERSSWYTYLGSEVEDKSLAPQLVSDIFGNVRTIFVSQALGVAITSKNDDTYYVITYNELTGYDNPVPFEYHLMCSISGRLHFALRKGELNISSTGLREHCIIHLEKDQLYHCINYEYGHPKHYVIDYDSATDLPIIRSRSSEIILQPNGVATYLRRANDSKTLITTPLHIKDNESVLYNLQDEERYGHILKKYRPDFKGNRGIYYTNTMYRVGKHLWGRLELRRDERGNANYYDKVGNTWASENLVEAVDCYVNKEEYLKEVEWLTKKVIDELKPNSMEAISHWRMRSMFLGKSFPAEKPKGYFIGTGTDLGDMIHNGDKSLYELFRPLESYSWDLCKLCLVDNKLYWVQNESSVSLVTAAYQLIGHVRELEDTNDIADMSWFLNSIIGN